MTEPGDARDERRAEALRAGLRRARSIDPKESARIDRFVVVGRLGKGAMGVVYEAYDDRLARGVAVKVLRKPRNPTGVTRLRREALALAQLSHPNVVPIYEVGPWEGGLFLAMELVRGKPLSDWAAEGHGPRELLPRLVEAARGLGAAHAAGIVHRDVKPENVLVGEDGHARVLDFGLARREETAEGEAPESKVEGAEAEPEDAAEPARPVDDPVTRDGAAVGTPLYMSPEHFFGRNVGPASDQWGFCAMAYRLLYGRRAFGGDDYPALRRAVLAGALEPPPEGVVPIGVTRAIVRGLSVDPRDRFPSMEALAAELERHAPAELDTLNARRVRAGVALVLLLSNLGAVLVLVQRPPPYFTPELLVRNPIFGAVGFTVAIAFFRRQLLATKKDRQLLGAFFLSWVGMAFHRILAVRYGASVLDTLVAEAFAYVGVTALTGVVVDRVVLLGLPILGGFLATAALAPGIAPLLFPVALGLELAVIVLAWGLSPRVGSIRPRGSLDGEHSTEETR